MRRPSFFVLAIVTFVLGVLFMVPFEGFPWRLIGMSFMVAFAVYGILAVASPEYLARRPDPAELGESEDAPPG